MTATLDEPTQLKSAVDVALEKGPGFRVLARQMDGQAAIDYAKDVGRRAEESGKSYSQVLAEDKLRETPNDELPDEVRKAREKAAKAAAEAERAEQELLAKQNQAVSLRRVRDDLRRRLKYANDQKTNLENFLDGREQATVEHWAGDHHNGEFLRQFLGFYTDLVNAERALTALKGWITARETELAEAESKYTTYCEANQLQPE